MGRLKIKNYISRLMAVLLALVLVFSAVPAVYADEYSGQCGDNLSWTLSAGTLTITGSGAMKNYPESEMAPWYTHREEIVRLVLTDGLTSIGNLAFYDCDSLIAVSIPESVKSIGSFAFAECSGLEMLDLGSVSSLGEGAFSDCDELKALRLPDTLKTIGVKAFYRCESINTVTIPASVTKLGVSAFGYCTMLVSAEVRASVDSIPSLLFYGCDRLSIVTIACAAEEIGEFAFRGCESLRTIYNNGSTMSAEEIREMVSVDLSNFGNIGYIAEGTPSQTITSGTAWDNEDGTYTEQNTSVSQGSNSTVTTNVSTTVASDQQEEKLSGESSAEIIVTVNDETGWSEAQREVVKALEKYHNNLGNNDAITQQAQIHVYAQGVDQVDPGFIDALAGRDLVVTVTTANGSVWRIPCKDLQKEKSGAYNLAYELTAGSDELSEKLGTAESFVLRFLSPAQVNAEVMIGVGAAYAGQNATLFQQKGSPERIQSVVVDRDGYAHFYLASVDDQTEYYIAMNLPDETDEAIVPDEMLNYYGNPIRTAPLEYEITGRKSSWNMELSQVTWIMVGVLAFCVVTVGVVMFMLNKRKLKMGYVPDLEEEA